MTLFTGDQMSSATAAKAEIYQRGMSRAELMAKLDDMFSTESKLVLKKGSDDEAVLNKTRMGKMIHSVSSSVKNGFTAKQHYAVVADIADLYEQSVKLLERNDRHGDPTVKIQRYGVPLHFGGAVAYITVKETSGRGKRVHNVELVEIKKLGGMLIDDGSPVPISATPSFKGDSQVLAGDGTGYNPATSQHMRLYNDNIHELRGKVNEKNF